MNKPVSKATILALVLVGLNACSLLSKTDRQPYYPFFTYSVYSDADVSLIETNNVVAKAIRSNHYVRVSDIGAFNSNIDKVFSEALTSYSVSIDDIKTQGFHHGIESIIKQFACEVYVSQQPADSIQLCPLSKDVVDNNIPYLPFIDGLRVHHRLSKKVSVNSGDIEFEFFLRSTHERSLETLWGAVHELGSIPDSELPFDSLVLTINMNAHKKSDLDTRWRSLHHEPLVFFVMLPSVDLILQNKNEIASMDFAYEKALLLIVDSR